MFGGPDKKIYTFPASDYPLTPKITVQTETEEEIVGAAVYHSSENEYYYLVAFEEYITVYSKDFKAVGTINIDVGEGLELSDIAIYQGEVNGAKEGLIGYAFESDDYGKASSNLLHPRGSNSSSGLILIIMHRVLGRPLLLPFSQLSKSRRTPNGTPFPRNQTPNILNARSLSKTATMVESALMIRKDANASLDLPEMRARRLLAQITAPVLRMGNVLLRICASVKTRSQDLIAARLQ